MFFKNNLKQKGVIAFEIPKRTNVNYRWRVIVGNGLWDHYKGQFSSFNFRQETHYDKFTFIQNSGENFAILKVAISSTHIGFLLIPLESFEQAPTKFFDYLYLNIQGQIKLIKEWGEFDNYKDLIFKDDVTSLFNQRKLDLDLEDCVRRHEMNGEPFFIYFIDVDHFKSVNDGHGHLVGTSLLDQLGDVIKSQFRESDYVYRYGGDEFVVIVRDVNKEKAFEIANRLLNSIKGHKFNAFDDRDNKNHDFQISVSIGVAGFPDDAKDKREILSLADRMMYEAKVAGRGQVRLANEIFLKKISNC